ncbi:MAG: ComEC family competence protein [Chitinophagaceae bacterium]|nr:MAG: ComEC family competence protein [Chitinophagaceae bacterium]
MAAQLWNKAPFIRFLVTLAAGIITQWYVQISLPVLLAIFAASFVCIAVYSFTAIRHRYRLSLLNGTAACLLFSAMGGLLVWTNDIRHNKRWAGHHLKEESSFVVTLQEPLVEKANSYKALASFTSINNGDSALPVTGKLIVYFKKDTTAPPLHYGTQLIFNKSLQEIKNAGNPGSFDYKTYSLFQGITHQVYLTAEDYVLLPANNQSPFQNFIFQSRAWIVNTLRKNISGEKEQGLAEALLIGYKDDLDKNLVQAYSNTGVVHIIAISGLHLGLIYWLLLLLTKPLKRHTKLVWLRLLLIVASLWLFSILAGAQPSVLRSAIMFTIIAIGEVMLRRSNIFNTLACSAMVLLCINPFWLWDVGFQLSYTAVLSIVLFFQPVYNWFHLQNPITDFLWKLTAVTIAAQILTLPISIYHFHQMPLLFLLTNFVAVPLSSVILLGEIILCGLFFLQPVASFIGSILNQLIYWMNSYVEQLDALPFAVWNFLSINIVQTVLLLVFAISGCYWLMEKQRRFAWTALGSFAFFMLIRAASFTDAFDQKKLVVYNVPKHTAIDVIQGRNFSFVGDTSLLYDDFARNFHLQPSRILHRITPQEMDAGIRCFHLNEKSIVVIDDFFPFVTANPKPTVDLVVLSKNPKLYISQLTNAFTVKQVVIDGAVPAWKAALWKKDCDSLKIPCYNVGEEGAFVMNW